MHWKPLPSSQQAIRPMTVVCPEAACLTYHPTLSTFGGMALPPTPILWQSMRSPSSL